MGSYRKVGDDILNFLINLVVGVRVELTTFGLWEFDCDFWGILLTWVFISLHRVRANWWDYEIG